MVIRGPMLDMGVAVTLLCKDTWEHFTAQHPQHLTSWLELLLVGVDGSPLTVHSRAKVKVKLGNMVTTANVVSGESANN